MRHRSGVLIVLMCVCGTSFSQSWLNRSYIVAYSIPDKTGVCSDSLQKGSTVNLSWNANAYCVYYPLGGGEQDYAASPSSKNLAATGQCGTWIDGNQAPPLPLQCPGTINLGSASNASSPGVPNEWIVSVTSRKQDVGANNNPSCTLTGGDTMDSTCAARGVDLSDCNEVCNPNGENFDSDYCSDCLNSISCQTHEDCSLYSEYGYCDKGSCVYDPNRSPIIIDVAGMGFHLTSKGDGVYFNMTGRGALQLMSWTDPKYHNAFLAMDANGDGVIQNGTQLFGSTMPQPGGEPNGFRALAQFDLPINGGNRDGKIDDRDGIWPLLVLWDDRNHNGISEPGEVYLLSAFKIKSISLRYESSSWTDRYGNRYLYRGRIVRHEGWSDRVLPARLRRARIPRFFRPVTQFPRAACLRQAGAVGALSGGRWYLAEIASRRESDISRPGW